MAAVGLQAVIDEPERKPFVLFGQESEIPRRFIAEPDGLRATMQWADGQRVEATARRGRFREFEDVS